MLSNGRTTMDGLSGSARSRTFIADEFDGIAGAATPASRMCHARIGSVIFFKACSPMSSKAMSILPRICLCASSEMQTPPGSAIPSRRAAMLTPSPKISLPSTMMSPTWMPMRNSIRSTCGRSILLSHTALDLNGAAHRIYDTSELSEHAIARVLDDLATMFADLGISESNQTLPQPDVCPFLVQAGQATISSHISRKDSCKPPFNAIVGQNGLPRSVDPSDISKHRALPLG